MTHRRNYASQIENITCVQSKFYVLYICGLRTPCAYIYSCYEFNKVRCCYMSIPAKLNQVYVNLYNIGYI